MGGLRARGLIAHSFLRREAPLAPLEDGADLSSWMCHSLHVRLKTQGLWHFTLKVPDSSRDLSQRLHLCLHSNGIHPFRKKGSAKRESEFWGKGGAFPVSSAVLSSFLWETSYQ